jgi:hypothetical protein
MGADDAWSAEIKRLRFTPDPDPLALDDDLAERLLDGELGPDQAPPGYAEVAALLAAAVAPPTPAELAGQQAALAELRAATRARGAIVWGSARPSRRRRVGLLVAVAVVGLSTTGIAAATSGTLPDPIGATARRILGTVDDATSLPAPTPGRQPAPSTGEGAAVGATSQGQGARPAGVPETTAGPGAGNDAPCRASKAHKGPDKTNKLHAGTSQAPVQAAGDADNGTSQCRNSRPDGTGGDGQENHPRSDGHGRGQAGEPPPDTAGRPGQGQPGPPPNSSGASPEMGRPPETGPPRP